MRGLGPEDPGPDDSRLSPLAGVGREAEKHEASHALREGLSVCIGFPGTVIGVDEAGATVDQGGRLRRASTLLIPDIAPGDQVYVAAGTIVERLDPAEAELITATLRETIARQAAEAETVAETEAETEP